jgi:hypothetical protein
VKTKKHWGGLSSQKEAINKALAEIERIRKAPFVCKSEAFKQLTSVYVELGMALEFQKKGVELECFKISLENAEDALSSAWKLLNEPLVE